MQNKKLSYSAIIIGFLMCVLFTSSHAQDDAKADKTGTNPVNFSPELRLYNEFTRLNIDGGGEQNVTTLEGRIPLLDGKVQFRVRARTSILKADFNKEN